MNIKKIYGTWLQGLTTIFGIDIAKKFDAKFRMHRSINLKNPKTLADKVSYIELHKQTSLASTCTDKYAVRDYVAGKGFGSALVPVVGGPWTNPEDIDFSTLPQSFVLKATHGCKMNYIVSSKDQLNEEKCHQEMHRWMETTYGTYSLEPHYTVIPHRIYAEAYLGDMSELIDYKFHCLNGEPEFVLVISDRKADGDKAMQVTIDCYDMEWNHLPVVCGAGSEVPGQGIILKPKHFKEMIEMSKKLSEDFDFVRVDLYERDDQILFGELTFSPATCVFPYLSEQFLIDMGKKLTIEV